MLKKRLCRFPLEDSGRLLYEEGADHMYEAWDNTRGQQSKEDASQSREMVIRHGSHCRRRNTD